jgi:parallel beta-helix repeat protein
MIRGSTFGPLRYRGMLLQTWNGLVENNMIQETARGGIVLEGVKGEGPYCHNVAILNNTFKNIGAFPYGGNGIDCTTVISSPSESPETPGISHSGILIQNNKFTNTKAHGIRVVRASNMIIDGNQFEKIGANNPEPKPVEPVLVEKSENIFLSGNTNEGAAY